MKRFKHVLVAELNTGQLRTVLRATYLVDAIGLNKIQGQPFKVREVIAAVDKQLEAVPASASSSSSIQVNA
jgi:2-oxoglutarate ferredoxin oxidoreductase subunit alpha